MPSFSKRTCQLSHPWDNLDSRLSTAPKRPAISRIPPENEDARVLVHRRLERILPTKRRQRFRMLRAVNFTPSAILHPLFSLQTIRAALLPNS
jgi:hypothetical protein